MTLQDIEAAASRKQIHDRRRTSLNLAEGSMEAETSQGSQNTHSSGRLDEAPKSHGLPLTNKSTNYPETDMKLIHPYVVKFLKRGQLFFALYILYSRTSTVNLLFFTEFCIEFPCSFDSGSMVF